MNPKNEKHENKSTCLFKTKISVNAATFTDM